MTGNVGYTGRQRKKFISKRDILKYAILIFILCVLSVMQTSFVKVNGNSVGLVLLFISAVGMLFGERDGGACGLIGGVIVDSLGGGVIYISPLVFAIIGYLCGICVSRLLQRNLPSYIVYMLIVGIMKQAVNVFYFVMLSDKFNLMKIFIDVLIPDYIAFILFSPVIYGFAYLLYKILNTKKKKRL